MPAQPRPNFRIAGTYNRIRTAGRFCYHGRFSFDA